MTTVAMIPARAGSKGVPGKNKRPLAGRPLIQWTIDAALEAKSIDRIIVTSDDPDILDIARQARVEAWHRPAALAQDHVQLDEVVLHVLRELELVNQAPDALVLLTATSPFRTAQHIDEAVGLHCDHRHTVMSVYRDMRFHWEAEPVLPGQTALVGQPIHHNPEKRLGRQQIDPVTGWSYTEAGSIYVSEAARVSREKSIRLPPFVMYVMDETDCVEIDTEWDWRLAEAEAVRRGSMA